MSATASTFSRGVTFVSSGETGTQATEFESAIKSITSSTTVGAVFVYDTRNDSDSGAWRKKARGSWYYETLNTATRGGRREFPSVALIVADDDGVTIYDGDDPSLPAWLVANVGGESSSPNKMTALGGGTIGNIGSAFALNGRIYLGGASTTGSQALLVWDFVGDFFGNYDDAAARGGRAGTIAERNTQVIVDGSFNTIIDSTVNDVAATIVEGSEIGALDLPIPTVSVATANGISIILPSGTVNSSNTGVSYSKVAFDSKSRLWRVQPNSNSTWMSFDEKSVFFTTGFSAGQTVTQSTHASASSFTPNYLGDVTAIATTSGDNLAVGTDEALNHYLFNPHNIDDSAVAYVTRIYNTGYMLGDIKGAWLTGGDASTTGRYDRSVGNTDLVENGTILHAAAETDADVTKYYDFSASNYFSQANNTDFDFGTGDFSISLWAKNTNWTGDQRFLGRSQSASARRLSLYASTVVTGSPPNEVTTTSLVFYLADGGATHVTVANVLKTNTWQHIFACRKSSKLYLYVDGRLVGTPVDSTTNITPTTASALVIGAETFDNLTSISNPFTNGSLSLVRISATAPTPQQVKEIYEAEAPLFQAGAKCLLQGEYNSTIEGLAYDKTTGLLHATHSAGTTKASATIFRGLEVADTFLGNAHDSNWTFNSATLLAANGGVSAYYRNGGSLLCDLPAIDVRGDINTADSKLPDDGKLHFSGVTTDATPTVIGQIPIAGGENYIVKANVIGCRYQSADSAHRIIVDLKGGFSRTMSGNVIAEPLMSKLSELEWSSSTMDVEFDVDTSANTIRIKVTGHSAVTAEWNATVEVQRISEKQYER